MTVDYSGIAVLVGAITAAFVSIGTFVMQWRSSKKLDRNKRESMAARESQTRTIIEQAVKPALNSPPPANPDQTGEA